MEQYIILGHIGEGAHGIVFKAKQIEVTPAVIMNQLFQIITKKYFLLPFGSDDHYNLFIEWLVHKMTEFR